MGFLNNWIYDITQPIRDIRSKIHGVKNVKDGIAADIKRAKRAVGIKDAPQQPPKPADESKK